MLEAREIDSDTASPDSILQVRRLDTSHLEVDTSYKAKSTQKSVAKKFKPPPALKLTQQRRKSSVKVAARLGISVSEAWKLTERTEKRRGSLDKISQVFGIKMAPYAVEMEANMQGKDIEHNDEYFVNTEKTSHLKQGLETDL